MKKMLVPCDFSKWIGDNVSVKHVVEFGPLIQTVLHTIEKMKADIVIMGTGGATGCVISTYKIR